MTTSTTTARATATTTLEKLFAGIFDRRDTIIEKLKQQARFVDNHLASKLLIQGLTPPSWLLSSSSSNSSSDFPHPTSISSASDLAGLNKDELITGLLLPPPRLAVPQFYGEWSLYSQPGAKASYVELPDDMCAGTSDHVQSTHGKSCQVQSQQQLPSKVHQSSHAVGTPNDNEVARIRDICSDPDPSLSKVQQRSRSRQKALELRSSGKRCLGKRNNNDICSSGAACRHAEDHNEFLNVNKPSPLCVKYVLDSEAAEEERIPDNSRRAIVPGSVGLEVDGLVKFHVSTDTCNAHFESITSVNNVCEGSVVADCQDDENGSHPFVTRARLSEGEQAQNVGHITDVELDGHYLKASSIGKDSFVEELGYAFPGSETIAASTSFTAQGASEGPRLIEEAIEIASRKMHEETTDPCLLDLPINVQPQIDLSYHSHVHDAEGVQSSIEGVSDTFNHNSDANPAMSLSLHVHDSQLAVEQPVVPSVEGNLQASLFINEDKTVTDLEILEVDALASHGRENESGKTSLIKFSPAISGNETEGGFSVAQSEALFHSNLLTYTKFASHSKPTEVQPAGLDTDYSFKSATGVSWPQFKRRKIQSGSFSMPRNMDAGVSSMTCVSDAEVHQNTACPVGKCSPDSVEEKDASSLDGSSVMSPAILNDEQQPTTLGIAEAKGSFAEDGEVNVGNGLFLTGGHSDYSSHIEDKSILTMSENMLRSALATKDKRKSLHEEDDFDASIESPLMEFMDVVGSDESMPMFEALMAERDKSCANISIGAVDFEKIYLSGGSMIERASILEQVCKYVTLNTPLSRVATEYESHTMPSVAQSMPNGLPDQIDFKSRLPLGDNSDQLVKARYLGMNGDNSSLLMVRSYSDSVPLPSAPSRWDSRMPYMSPVRNSLEGISSKSGGSSKLGSSNPDLVCFPIEEDTETCDEYMEKNDLVDMYRGETCSKAGKTPVAREPLRDITAENINMDLDITAERSSSESNTNEVTTTEMHNMSNKENETYYTRSKHKNAAADSQSYSVWGSSMKKSSNRHKSRLKKSKLSEKPSLRSEGKNLLAKENKFTNIVSNVNSFLPLVQQKQAAALEAANLARRETRLKVLEAAEAAKRLEEKRENERKQKKEALKLERARLKEENQRQMELQKKLKEEERKKKEADIAARKRQREEEERKEKERKRRRTENARKQQRELEGKVEAVPKENICKVPGERVRDIANELSRSGVFQSNAELSSMDDHKAFAGFNFNGKAEGKGSTTPMFERDVHYITEASREPSYEISPYQCSDDEEDEEDEKPKKFIPSWGRKSAVAQALPTMLNVDPDMIFPLKSFCSMDEVLLPRKLQRRLRAG